MNRSLETRSSKVKDRFTNWRRKSEPGFQSYVSLNQSEDEQKDNIVEDKSTMPLREIFDDSSIDELTTESKVNVENSPQAETKDVNEQQRQQQVQTQTVEEIVGHILMQNQEFQRLLEKQRNNSAINVRHQQRFNKHVSADTSDDSDVDIAPSYLPETANNNDSNNNKDNRGARTNRRGHRLVHSNNAWNAFSSPQPRDVQPTLQLRYDNLRSDNDRSQTNINETTAKIKTNRVNAKRAMFEAFKRQSIVTDSKIIKTALRIREHSGNDDQTPASPKIEGSAEDFAKFSNEPGKPGANGDPKGFGNYDNLEHVWDGLDEVKGEDDSPTRPAVWLTKLCEGLPTSPHKAGSLPRSFQISPNPQTAITKARFLQRDGKPMSERPFTIASDKPAEINLEDMERYASSCQPEGRIAKFPTIASTSTFFLTLDDSLTDAYSEIHVPVTSTNVHPDHKIYRANFGGSAIIKNVFSKAGSRLQGLRTTASTETLESNEEFERTKYSRSLSNGKSKKKSRLRLSRESSSDVEDHPVIGCVPASTSTTTIPDLYYKQGSSGLGARIAQSDYADPSFLFSESKRAELASVGAGDNQKINTTIREATAQRDSETDSFYERSFETIENYIDADCDYAFRDSAIFSDADEILSIRQAPSPNPTPRIKVAPPVPAKRKPRNGPNTGGFEESKFKPVVAHKPSNLRSRTKTLVDRSKIDLASKDQPTLETKSLTCLKSVKEATTSRVKTDTTETDDKNDVSAGQSQAGWVRKMVGQLQAHIET